VNEFGFEQLAALQDFPDGLPSSVELESGEQVCIVRLGDEVFAFSEDCPHGETPMSDGEIVEDYIIECSMHCSQFDVRDGSVVEPPAQEPLTTYDTKIVDGHVWIRVH